MGSRTGSTDTLEARLGTFIIRAQQALMAENNMRSSL